MDHWRTVLGMMQVYVPSVGLFFVGGILGHGVASRLSISLRPEWTRWMTTLYLFSLLIPLPLWVEGSLFYRHLWLVYALLSLLIGIARGLAFPAREEVRRKIQERVQRAREAIQHSAEQTQNENKHLMFVHSSFVQEDGQLSAKKHREKFESGTPLERRNYVLTRCMEVRKGYPDTSASAAREHFCGWSKHVLCPEATGMVYRLSESATLLWSGTEQRHQRSLLLHRSRQRHTGT